MDALSARLERIKSLKGESGLLDVKGQAIKMLVHLRAVFGQKGMAMYMCLYLNVRGPAAALSRETIHHIFEDQFVDLWVIFFLSSPPSALQAIFVAVREFLDIFPPIQNFVVRALVTGAPAGHCASAQCASCRVGLLSTMRPAAIHFLVEYKSCPNPLIAQKTYASFLIMPNEKNDDTSLALNVIEFGV